MNVLLYIIVFAFFAILDGCPGQFVENDRAVKALETQGYSDVKITDKSVYFVSWKGCSSSDSAKFDAIATNPVGKKVGLYVCTA